jgi:uncharacterized protein (TIGR03067 family)
MRTLLIVLAALVLGFAPAPLPKRDRTSASDRRRLDGVWVVEATRYRGNPVLSIHYGNGLTFRTTERLAIARGELWFTDREDVRQPARWALRFQNGTNDLDLRSLPDGPAHLLGFYALQGATLTISFRSPNEGRPRASSDDYVATIVLTRGNP